MKFTKKDNNNKKTLEIKCSSFDLSNFEKEYTAALLEPIYEMGLQPMHIKLDMNKNHNGISGWLKITTPEKNFLCRATGKDFVNVIKQFKYNAIGSIESWRCGRTQNHFHKNWEKRTFQTRNLDYAI